jgi:hypothetical protein
MIRKREVKTGVFSKFFMYFWFSLHGLLTFEIKITKTGNSGVSLHVLTSLVLDFEGIQLLFAKMRNNAVLPTVSNLIILLI